MTGDHCPAQLACRSGDQDEAPKPPPTADSPPSSISGFRIADVFYSTLPLMAQKISCLKCASTVRSPAFLRFECGFSFHESCLISMTGDHCPAQLACRSGDQDEAPRPPPLLAAHLPPSVDLG
ncbi:hypothetical protein AVEN_237486-1 [Araneus ventricosus]|uniref:Uncharacterized protein n=1 Tax=Araneus ventricosus TaxID=182803 RepID=A0A4Y2NGJ7_ARAVE|nr:hypothetical protein AVEN_237486-1 [Araneus ventricosus]